MKSELHPAAERGKADHGWLQANFSFSFANYFNPGKVQFGLLRVLNDDTIAAGTGFGTHPHDNMEIVTIPLEGGLQHRDSMGNEGIISFGEVQVMSAGTGVLHSEMNASKDHQAKTLQLWIFPEKQNVAPRYDQKKFDFENNVNEFVTVVTPYDKVDRNALWIYQQAFFAIGIFESGKTTTYGIKIPGNGVYLFLLEGKIEIDGKKMDRRDALGITETQNFEISIHKNARILLIEVPMSHN